MSSWSKVVYRVKRVAEMLVSRMAMEIPVGADFRPALHSETLLKCRRNWRLYAALREYELITPPIFDVQTMSLTGIEIIFSDGEVMSDRRLRRDEYGHYSLTSTLTRDTSKRKLNA